MAWMIFKKEIKESLIRDKKTFLTSTVIAILMFPLLSFILGKFMLSSTKDVAENLKLAFGGNTDSAIVEFIKDKDNINVIDVKDGKASVEDGDIYVYLEIPKNFDDNLTSDTSSNIKATYDNSSTKSSTAYSMISSYINEYSSTIVSSRLSNKGIDTALLNPITIDEESFEDDSTASSLMMMSMLFPMLILTYSSSGVLGVALDSGAGEKERGTLEPLLTTKANRTAILVGKLMSITTVGMISSISNILGLSIATQIPNGMFAIDGTALTTTTIIILGILSLLMTIAFGAFELAISFYARTLKEAQSYLAPITIISVFVGYAPMMFDVKDISTMYFNIPLLNVCLIIKEAIYGIVDFTHIGITIAWLLVYVVLSFALVKSMFSREKVIFRV